MTFLVYVWLNYKPFNLDIFPDTMLSKLSKPVDTHILFDNEKTTKNHHTIPDESNDRKTNLEIYRYIGTKAEATQKDHDNDKLADFRWSLGNTLNERLEMQLPLKTIQRQMKNGGDIKLVYEYQSETERATRLVKEPIANTSE